MLQEVGTHAPVSVSIEDAVKLSGIGRTTLFAAIKSGALIARKVGSRTIISYDDLRAFISALPVRKIGEAA
jgi:hypothetical protein